MWLGLLLCCCVVGQMAEPQLPPMGEIKRSESAQSTLSTLSTGWSDVAFEDDTPGAKVVQQLQALGASEKTPDLQRLRQDIDDIERCLRHTAVAAAGFRPSGAVRVYLGRRDYRQCFFVSSLLWTDTDFSNRYSDN